MRIISGTARGTKLFTLEGLATRPTLDRIKEPLFSIIQNRIINSEVLDLFAGSGALGIETLSRGASKCVFCDYSNEAMTIVKKNLEKTKLMHQAENYVANYKVCLKKLKERDNTFDIIFLDPPYDSNLICFALQEIIELKLLKKDGTIIAETDDEERILKELKCMPISIDDIRKYGRVVLLFISRKG